MNIPLGEQELRHNKINVNYKCKVNSPNPGDVITTNGLTKLNGDWTINMTKSVNKKNAPLSVKLVQDNIGTNLLTKFHLDWTINVASRYRHIWENASPPCDQIVQATRTIFELNQDSIGTNLLTKINAPPPGSHVFSPTGTIFELVQDMIGTNVLLEFQEDWTINVTSRALTWQMLMPHNTRWTKGDRKCSR
ncbi:hypothetical protein DPMN_182552 [Dreissena polymorpha]|uniref:Uncharacterized protein n=1 Tax=Dreissena polymorpha TaxID=45954 RepID=A0A9D4DGP7_DREPO|nr:hypothetical protein DPMN_182552 [Dreissena polymorpha]